LDLRVDRSASSMFGPDSDAPPCSLAAWVMGECYGLGA